MRKNKLFNSMVVIIGSLLVGTHVFAATGHAPLQAVENNLCDQASLQRGAKLYVNYCQGCHSLEHARYKSVAADIGIKTPEGEVLEALVQTNLNFVSDKVTSPMKSAMPKKDAGEWFGVAPPDLTLTTRVRGKNWVYTYLKSFYKDETRPWGVNNLVFPDVGMPHVLHELQGTQIPRFEKIRLKAEDGTTSEHKVVEKLELASPGAMSETEYDRAITDLVNFLDYVGEPHKLERQRIGVWVILFLIIFTLFAYLLKREYWKDVH